MRILYLDCDTLRPDHLGCYGYHRDTSPNIDRIAAEGLVCHNYYAPDAPCLPSRSALFSGRFGIHTGVVSHGGTAADPHLEGPRRMFRQSKESSSWMDIMREAGFHTVSVSPFAERHSSWWFYRGFSEMFNPGKGGIERADEVAPIALDWLDRHGAEDSWFLQVNMWDPHTPYRTPMEYGNPFEDEPIADWVTQEMIDEQHAGFGSHSPQDVAGFGPNDPEKWPRLPREIETLADYKQWIDGYDTGIRYMDDYIGMILAKLEELGVMDDTVIMVSSDHGENQGELNVYGDHQTADHITSRVPMIIRWPGLPGGLHDAAFHYNLDLPPTLADMIGARKPAKWDGQSFAETLRAGEADGRDYLVVSQCAWACQRAVRFGPWILIRTYHDGLKDYPPIMLFDLDNDPHELNDLATAHPEIVHRGLALLEEWHDEMMKSGESQVDPMRTVLAEGGPFHSRGMLDAYAQRLRDSGRAQHAETLLARHQTGEWRSPTEP